MIDYLHGEPMKYFAPSATMTKEQYKEKIEEMCKSGDYLYSRKYDGNWSRAVINQNGISALQTRGISKKTKTYGQVQDKVLWWNDVKNAFTSTTVILGELYLPGRIDRDVGAILRCLARKAIERQRENPLQWRIFDVLCYEGENLMDKPITERIKYIDKVVKDINNPLVIGIEYHEMGEDFDVELEKIFMERGEGVVAYRKSCLYEFGKRGPHAYDTFKIKQKITSDIDAFIIGVKPPTKEYNGKYLETHTYWHNIKTDELLEGEHFIEYCNGTIPLEPVSKDFFFHRPSAIQVGVYTKDNQIYHLVDISGISEELKDALRDHFEEYYKQPVKISGMSVSLTENNAVSIRHPKLICLRDDIDIKDCTLSKILTEY